MTGRIGISIPVADGESETELVNKASRGDKDAYRVLVEKYQSKVFSLVFSIVKSREDAEDIVQESFVKAYFSLKNFRQDSSFYTWVYRVAYNMTIDFKRKVGRRPEYVTDGEREIGELGDDDRAIVAGKISDPLQTFEQKELAASLNRALSGLSDEHRAVMMLREIDGLSYNEIADSLGVSKGTVMSRIHYAKKYLQRALRESAPNDYVEVEEGTNNDSDKESLTLKNETSLKRGINKNTVKEGY